jgi:hypothetical protein
MTVGDRAFLGRTRIAIEDVACGACDRAGLGALAGGGGDRLATSITDRDREPRSRRCDRRRDADRRHYGPVAHYLNARGISRPTGLTVFVADEIASDDHARSRMGIIFTRLLVDSLTAGSNQRLASEFEALPRPTTGPASGLDRFVQRSADPQ